MSALLRIIDANANRAREGLRFLEDIARFGLDDGGLSGEFKSLRHLLTAAMNTLGDDALLASRDTPGDVGTGIKAPTELTRADLRASCIAAGSRVGEALRAIEESAKVLGRAVVAVACEQARYRTYTLVPRLVQRLPGADVPQWKLCVLITESLCTHHAWPEVARLAIDGGADCIQLREKNLEGGELARRARELVAICRPRGVHVIINDRLDVALAADADGVHLGQTDLAAPDARRIADVSLAGGRRLLIGVSTENLAQAREAFATGADYVGLGPMFATTTKEKPRIAGPAYAREFVADPVIGNRPHLAIGGIMPANAAEVAAAGARGFAVSSVVCGAKNPAVACEALLAPLRTPRASVGPP
jgi:thiamine-phosphate pyrophosphorylase